MSNQERRQAINTLLELYSATDKNVAFSHMPQQVNDEDGDRFNNFFDFLQTLYSLRGYYMTLEPNELLREVGQLKNMAQEFDYPMDQIEAFNAKTG